MAVAMGAAAAATDSTFQRLDRSKEKNWIRGICTKNVKADEAIKIWRATNFGRRLQILHEKLSQIDLFSDFYDSKFVRECGFLVAPANNCFKYSARRLNLTLSLWTKYCNAIANKFTNFDHFASCLFFPNFSDLFGHVRPCSDMLGHVHLCSDGCGCVQMKFGIVDWFEILFCNLLMKIW